MPAFPFDPPPVTCSPELRWLLVRAFGPTTSEAPAGVDASRLPALGRKLGVTPRLVARAGAHRLRRELGAAAAGALMAEHAVAARAAERRERFVREIAEAAARLGVPLALLKGAALTATGVVDGSARSATDVDVLVEPAAERTVRRWLESEGFRPTLSVIVDIEHHLPPFADPRRGVTVEVHRCLPGVHLDAGRRFARLEALEQAGLLAAAPGLAAGCRVPARPLLAASVLVHAIAYHAWRPGSYPVLRALGDLLDLGFAVADADAAAASYPWITRWVTPEQIAVTAALCAALARGADNRATSAESEAGGLLAHIVAATTVPAYNRTLELGEFLARPTQHTRPVRYLRGLVAALAPTRSHAAAKLGRKLSRSAYVAHLAARPFTLAAAVARSAVRAGARRIGPPRRLRERP